MNFNRIAFRYSGRIAPIPDYDDLGWYDYEVSVQGKRWRPARNNEDLFAARSWLRSSGFQMYDCEFAPRPGPGLPTRLIERWRI